MSVAASYFKPLDEPAAVSSTALSSLDAVQGISWLLGEPAARMFNPWSPPRLNFTGIDDPAFARLRTGGLSTGGRKPAKLQITVTVADVLPNGIIAVRGEKWMTLNTGDELVRIAGLVRADDIATDNTVPSTRVADARITYSGTGSFADASQPGWFDRFFLSPLFPF